MSILSLIGGRAGIAMLALAIIAGLWLRLNMVQDANEDLRRELAVSQAAVAAMRDVLAGDATIGEAHDALSEGIPAEGSELDPVLADLLERLRRAGEPKGGPGGTD